MRMKKEIEELEKKFPEVEWPKPEPTPASSFYRFERTLCEVIRENLDDVKDVECFVNNRGVPRCSIEFEMSVYHAPNEKHLTVTYMEFIDPADPIAPQIERLQTQKERIRELLTCRS